MPTFPDGLVCPRQPGEPRCERSVHSHGPPAPKKGAVSSMLNDQESSAQKNEVDCPRGIRRAGSGR